MTSPSTQQKSRFLNAAPVLKRNSSSPLSQDCDIQEEQCPQVTEKELRPGAWADDASNRETRQKNKGAKKRFTRLSVIELILIISN